MTMSHAIAQLLATLALIALIIVASPYLRRLGGDIEAASARLNADLRRRLAVYSAETIRHEEAEFIRDKLPKRFPTVVVVALCVLCAAAAWWLTR